MNTEEKYKILLYDIGIMLFHPFQNNHCCPFTAFSDSLPKEIIDEAEVLFKITPLYQALLEEAKARLK